MTGEEAALVDALKWAVGPERPASGLAPADAEALAELADYHRVLPLLIARLTAGRPGWFPVRLLTRLRVRQHGIARRIQEQQAAAREISRALCRRGLAPPLFIKGFAAHALTGDAQLLHFSGDIDCLASDPEAAWDALHGLGYAGKRKDTHEWANLRRDDIALDLHRWFPVRAYPDAVRAASADALARITEAAPFAGRIGFENLADGAMPGVAPGTEDLWFPRPELLALIHAAHLLPALLTRLHFLNPQRGPRLYELLSADAFARHPCFRAERFQALVGAFGAEDAVLIANVLARAYLGRAILPERGGAALPQAAFPEHLPYGGWVCLQETDDWLLPRDAVCILDQLGASSHPPVCSLDVRAARCLRVEATGPMPPTHLDIAWEPEARVVTVVWRFAAPDGRWDGGELLAHLGHDTSVRVPLCAAGAVGAALLKSYALPAGRAASAEAGDTEARRWVRVICPVPAGPPWNDALSLLLAARLPNPDGAAGEAAVTLPLRLRR